MQFSRYSVFSYEIHTFAALHMTLICNFRDIDFWNSHYHIANDLNMQYIAVMTLHETYLLTMKLNELLTLSLRTLIIEVCLNGVTVSLRTLIIEVCLYDESILKLRKCPKHWHTSCMPVPDAPQALICSKLNRIIVKQQFILIYETNKQYQLNIIIYSYPF